MEVQAESWAVSWLIYSDQTLLFIPDVAPLCDRCCIQHCNEKLILPLPVSQDGIKSFIVLFLLTILEDSETVKITDGVWQLVTEIT